MMHGLYIGYRQINNRCLFEQVGDVGEGEGYSVNKGIAMDGRRQTIKSRHDVCDI